MGEFEAFDRKDGRGGHIGTGEDPVVTVSKEGVYFGADVWRGVLDEAEYVEWLTDAEDSRVGFRAADESEAGANAYSISEYQARAAPVWKRLGMVVEETTHVPLDVESEDFPVIDVSRFIGGSGNDAPQDEGAADHEATADEVPDGPDEGATLDRERVETAMGQAGINGDATPEKFVAAVDERRTPFAVASAIGVSRANADALIRRLGLEDALESDGGLAKQRFERDEEASA